MSNKNNSVNRREFLKYFGAFSAAGFSPLSWLIESVITGYFNKALAQQAGINPRNLILIYSAGGRGRWAFDLFLNPQNNSGFVSNPACANKYTATNGAYTNAVYATANVNGINAPWIWQYAVPAPGGATRPMGNLMSNMMTIQGLNALSPDHPGATANLFNPFGSLQSLPFLVGDYSAFPISVLNTTSNLTLNSKNNKSTTNLYAYSNWAQALMDPFIRKTGAAFNSNRFAMKSVLDNAAAALAQEAMARQPGVTITETDRKSAVQLLEGSLGDINAFWSTALAKYQDLMTRSFTTIVPGINDMPIGNAVASRTVANGGLAYKWQGANNVTATDKILTVADLRTLYDANSTMSRLPESMALTEFVMKNKLSQSILFSADSINGTQGRFPPDDHFAGVMPQVISLAQEYRAWAACLLELISQIQSFGTWNDTVITWASEFGRQPRFDMAGTDHGPYAGSATFYSGAITGPMILGKLLKNPLSTQTSEVVPNTTQLMYPGTYGNGDGTRDYGNLISTMATMLRVPTPITARNSMVTESNGKFVSLIESTTLV